MRLIKMSCQPEQTTLRWVVNGDGEIIGAIGKAKDALTANYIRPAEALPITTYRNKNEWVAIRMDSELVRGYPSRKEAVAAFRRGGQG